MKELILAPALDEPSELDTLDMQLWNKVMKKLVFLNLIHVIFKKKKRKKKFFFFLKKKQ